MDTQIQVDAMEVTILVQINCHVETSNLLSNGYLPMSLAGATWSVLSVGPNSLHAVPNDMFDERNILACV